ncbi:MAG TPA: PD-(D/E)XK nuclease family protein [Acidimicrobiia bacterium]
MRQSLMGTADTCLKRVEFILQDPEYRSNVNRAMGTGYHAGLAEHYMGLMRGEPTTWEAVVRAAEDAFHEDVEKAGNRFSWVYQPKGSRIEEKIFSPEEAVELMTSTLFRYFDEGHSWDQQPIWKEAGLFVVAVELEFNQDFPEAPGWRRGGTIDLVLATPDGWYTLVDHKTAKKKWSRDKGTPTNPQFGWYMQAWSQHANVPLGRINTFYDIMSFDGHFERRQVFRTPHQVELTIRRAAELANLIDRGGPFPANPGSFLCHKEWCDFWSECPYGVGLKFDEYAA